jgi:hypothetical protein
MRRLVMTLVVRLRRRWQQPAQRNLSRHRGARRRAAVGCFLAAAESFY